MPRLRFLPARFTRHHGHLDVVRPLGAPHPPWGTPPPGANTRLSSRWRSIRKNSLFSTRRAAGDCFSGRYARPRQKSGCAFGPLALRQLTVAAARAPAPPHGQGLREANRSRLRDALAGMTAMAPVSYGVSFRFARRPPDHLPTCTPSRAWAATLRSRCGLGRSPNSMPSSPASALARFFRLTSLDP